MLASAAGTVASSLIRMVSSGFTCASIHSAAAIAFSGKGGNLSSKSWIRKPSTISRASKAVRWIWASRYPRAFFSGVDFDFCAENFRSMLAISVKSTASKGSYLPCDRSDQSGSLTEAFASFSTALRKAFSSSYVPDGSFNIPSAQQRIPSARFRFAQVPFRKSTRSPQRSQRRGNTGKPYREANKVGLIASEWDSSLEGDTVSYKFITIEQTSA